MIARLRSWLGYAIPINALAFFFESMTIQLRSGKSISEVLRSATIYGCDPELQRICAAIVPSVRNDISLRVSLQGYERRFPEIVIRLLKVGETSGDMADAAQRLADNFKETISLERQFKLNIYDPRLCLFALCLMQLLSLIARAAAAP